MLLVGLAYAWKKEGVTMVINFEELHPNERAELERNIFFFYIGTVERMGEEQLFMADDIRTGMLCN